MIASRALGPGAARPAWITYASTRSRNGLAVLTREVHTAPIATFFIWYRVGARDEPQGMSGASHWVEHMMFKRTQKLAPGDIGRMVEGRGRHL